MLLSGWVMIIIIIRGGGGKTDWSGYVILYNQMDKIVCISG